MVRHVAGTQNSRSYALPKSMSAHHRFMTLPLGLSTRRGVQRTLYIELTICKLARARRRLKFLDIILLILCMQTCSSPPQVHIFAQLLQDLCLFFLTFFSLGGGPLASLKCVKSDMLYHFSQNTAFVGAPRSLSVSKMYISCIRLSDSARSRGSPPGGPP